MNKISSRITRAFARLFSAGPAEANLEILTVCEYADLPSWHPAGDEPRPEPDSRRHRRFSAADLDSRLSP